MACSSYSSCVRCLRHCLQLTRHRYRAISKKSTAVHFDIWHFCEGHHWCEYVGNGLPLQVHSCSMCHWSLETLEVGFWWILMILILWWPSRVSIEVLTQATFRMARVCTDLDGSGNLTVGDTGLYVYVTWWHLVTFGHISRSHFTAVCFLTNLGHHGHQVVQLRSPVWLRQRHGLLLDQGSLRFGWAVLVAVQHLALDFHKDARRCPNWEAMFAPHAPVLSCPVKSFCDEQSFKVFQSWPYSRLNTTAMVFSWAAIAFYLFSKEMSSVYITTASTCDDMWVLNGVMPLAYAVFFQWFQSRRQLVDDWIIFRTVLFFWS